MSDIKESIPVRIEEEIKKSYLSYATSVIVSRALPDVRDGLKPVNRRILYAMMEAGCLYDRPYRKSARVVGDVLGKYHPHGRDAVYESMVRLAQDFSMRVMLVDGQGNFGSMDGDKAAADRYTEVRLKLAAHYLLEDYDKDTVDFKPNYDDTLMMPEVLPARFPHVLVNGASGIAVGMATNIPPHNLGEIVEACCLLIDDPEASLSEVMQHVQGPDFPTGGLILGEKGLNEAYQTGKGTIYIRCRSHFEQVAKDRTALIISEIPYQVNKSRLIENIAELVREKELEGISDLRDESDREGVRVVIELKRDATPEVVLNRLYTISQLQISFGISLRVLDHGRPVRMGLIPILNTFLEFRKDVILRRTRYYLRKARERALLLWGLFVAVLNVDEVVACIRSASDPQEARDFLIAREWDTPLLPLYAGLWQETPEERTTYRLSVEQAKAILELRLHRLTRLEKDKILTELQKLIEDTKAYRSILESQERLKELMKEELLEVKKILGSPRRTTLSKEWTCDTEDLIEREEMVVTSSVQGFIKRVPLDSYRAQRRGGKGRAAMTLKDQDALSNVFVANTHTTLLFFSSLGRTYKLKVYDLPLGSPQARGRPLVNVFPLWASEESLAAIVPILEESDNKGLNTVVFATSSGSVRRNAFSDFANLKVQGRMAMRFEHPDEKLAGVSVCRDDQDILLTTRQGKCLRFPVKALRQFTGRTSTGVKGINLAEGDAVVSMAVLDHTDFLAQERAAYLHMMSARRRQQEAGEEGVDSPADETIEEAEVSEGLVLTEERVTAMEAQEQFLLTVSEKGYGKRTSAYAYRCAGRGGQGVAAMEVNLRNGPVVHALPVEENDQVLLLTLTGQMIRCPVKDIRITGRTASGVTLLRAEDRVRSVFRVPGSLEDLTSDKDEGETLEDSLFDQGDESVE